MNRYAKMTNIELGSMRAMRANRNYPRHIYPFVTFVEWAEDWRKHTIECLTVEDEYDGELWDEFRNSDNGKGI